MDDPGKLNKYQVGLSKLSHLPVSCRACLQKAFSLVPKKGQIVNRRDRRKGRAGAGRATMGKRILIKSEGQPEQTHTSFLQVLQLLKFPNFNMHITYAHSCILVLKYRIQGWRDDFIVKNT